MRGQDSFASRASQRLPVFIVWIAYQRRSDLLSHLLCRSDPVYFPHCFPRWRLREFEYLIKLFRTIFYFRRFKPAYALLQAPPVFAALAAIVTKTPYVVDVHNGLVQSFWAKVPLTQLFLDRAAVLIAHNSEIASALQERVPAAKIVVIQDPIEKIHNEGRARQKGKILFICSFDRDEPVSLILEIIQALPEIQFTITANVQKLPRELRMAYQACPNLVLPGFLETADYHALLTSSQAAIVLSTMPSVQPSGAVEALSSDTPLIVSKTTLTEELFGQWAMVCDNDLESIVAAILDLRDEATNLQVYRTRWNSDVAKGVAELGELMQGDVVHANSYWSQ